MGLKSGVVFGRSHSMQERRHKHHHQRRKWRLKKAEHVAGQGVPSLTGRRERQPHHRHAGGGINQDKPRHPLPHVRGPKEQHVKHEEDEKDGRRQPPLELHELGSGQAMTGVR